LAAHGVWRQVGQGVFSGIADPALRMLAGCVLIFVGVLVVMSLVRHGSAEHGQGARG
jgi:uncharacterized protein YjeT (DUF2065 family)